MDGRWRKSVGLMLVHQIGEKLISENLPRGHPSDSFCLDHLTDELAQFKIYLMDGGHVFAVQQVFAQADRDIRQIAGFRRAEYIFKSPAGSICDIFSCSLVGDDKSHSAEDQFDQFQALIFGLVHHQSVIRESIELQIIQTEFVIQFGENEQ